MFVPKLCDYVHFVYVELMNVNTYTLYTAISIGT